MLAACARRWCAGARRTRSAPCAAPAIRWMRRCSGNREPDRAIIDRARQNTHTARMRILAIDTALPACSACILDSDAADPVSSETIPMARGHAEALLPLIERVVAHAEGGF